MNSDRLGFNVPRVPPSEDPMEDEEAMAPPPRPPPQPSSSSSSNEEELSEHSKRSRCQTADDALEYWNQRFNDVRLKTTLRT